MKELIFDAAVIGGGAAGMAAALELDAAGFSAALIDREDHLGGILMQCIHNGFGLHEFGEELTGPEFAERLIERVLAGDSAPPGNSRIAVFLNTTVTSFTPPGEAPEFPRPAAMEEYKELFCVSPDQGVLRILARAVILAMGCRERNRGNVRIPGSRPAGVYTAGLAQRLVNIEGYIPGRNVVIIGSGDIGLIMARRMTWAGCSVKAVVEIMPYPAGLTRNIVQCLQDFDIPLHLSCQTTNIYGSDRVEGVEVTPMENGTLVPEKRFRIDCDTVLLSVGLAPENELSKDAGVQLNGTTGGPLVDSSLMTNVEGVFACGNVLHVHDLADWVAEESRRAGRHAAAWLRGERSALQVRAKAGSNVRYVNPGKLNPQGENKLYLRSLIVKNDAVLEIRADNRVIRSIKKNHVQPSEMINLNLGPKDLENISPGPDSVLEFSIV
ncbi:MAG: NAD(P)/FAD-dependent oxidoreductase [Spirochaetaceae bacterium]|jgi:NADPH-dependent 2,4-dienoyl-CoA reductase/sulfur reductase-like enzyme|nr:NAD(P)/FAD-dependent oxidoreductase [Spirochaetaceae bacterium]